MWLKNNSLIRTLPFDIYQFRLHIIQSIESDFSGERDYMLKLSYKSVSLISFSIWKPIELQHTFYGIGRSLMLNHITFGFHIVIDSVDFQIRISHQTWSVAWSQSCVGSVNDRISTT